MNRSATAGWPRHRGRNSKTERSSHGPASRLSGTPLRIVGDGPERAALTEQAARSGADVQLLGSVSSESIRDLYRRANAVLNLAWSEAKRKHTLRLPESSMP